MPRRIQYSVVVEGISNAQAKERPQVDKWLGSAEPPQANWAAARASAMVAVSAPCLAFVSPGSAHTFPERTQLDKYVPLPTLPRWDVPRLQYTYPTLADPISPIFIERTQVDKWFSETQRPRFDVARTQYDAPTFAAPISPTFAEAPQVDKWFRETERPRFDVPRQQHTYPTFAAPTSPTFKETAQLDKWFSETQRPRFDVARQQYTYPAHAGPVSTTFTETPGLDKWYKATEVPRFDVARLQYAAPTLAAPVTTPVSTPLPDKWFGETQRPRFDVARTQYTYPSHAGPTSPTFAERTQIDKWLPSYPDRLVDQARNQALYPVNTLDAFPRPPSVATSVDRWYVVTSTPRADVPRLQHLQQQAGTGPISATFPERTQLDKWYRPAETPRFDLPRTQYMAPQSVVPTLADAARLDAWFSAQPLPIVPAPRIHAVTGTAPLRVPEPITLDKWFAPDVPRRDMPRLQYTYPSLARPTGIVFREAPQLDKWFVNTERPVWDMSRIAHITMMASVLPPTVPLPPTVTPMHATTAVLLAVSGVTGSLQAGTPTTAALGAVASTSATDLEPF